jgi:dihydroorotate dehydrogenase (NAD+) catalytic subunit
MRIRVGGLELANPVLVASGTFGYGTEVASLVPVGRLGGIVTKTVTLEARQGNPPPRMVETPSGLLNAIGLQNVGVEAFLREKLPSLRALDCAVVVSIGGRTPEEFRQVAGELAGAEGVDALEVNISCPNVREGGMEFSQDPALAARVVGGVRKAWSGPLWVKLSPNVTSIVEVARACREAGADALTAINTLLGLSVDPWTERPRLAVGFGGLSGPAIRPVALARIRQLHVGVGGDLVGVGGITSGEEALEFLLAGARAVQVGSASFPDPAAAVRILEELEAALAAKGVRSVEEVVGRLRWPGED